MLAIVVNSGYPRLSITPSGRVSIALSNLKTVF